MPLARPNGPVLLFGANGQVGSALRELLTGKDDLIVPTRSETDFRTPSKIAAIIRSVSPSWIINAAAYTAVDAAEADRDTAFLVNQETPTIIAREARQCGAFLIHYSTDYVFDGKKDFPYTETDEARPVNVYGESKLAGEAGIAEYCETYAILRTSWVYAHEGRNFLNAMRGLSQTQSEIRIVADQIGSPTWAGAIAAASLGVMENIQRQTNAGTGNLSGLYHLSAGGHTNWAEFAGAIFKAICPNPPTVIPISTEEYGLPAERPRYTVLDNARIIGEMGIRMPDWRQQLNSCLAGLTPRTNFLTIPR